MFAFILVILMSFCFDCWQKQIDRHDRVLYEIEKLQEGHSLGMNEEYDHEIEHDKALNEKIELDLQMVRRDYLAAQSGKGSTPTKSNDRTPGIKPPRQGYKQYT